MPIASQSLPYRHATGYIRRTLSVEIALLIIRPRLDAALKRLEVCEELPASVRRPNLTSGRRQKTSPDLGLLIQSWRDYRIAQVELSGRSDRDLADIAIRRETISDIAMASSFGWLLACDLDGADGRLASLRQWCHGVRVFLLPTRDERDEAYLADAGDMNELEHRIRSLEQRRAGRRTI